jgi:replicative DNA helicase
VSFFHHKTKGVPMSLNFDDFFRIVDDLKVKADEIVAAGKAVEAAVADAAKDQAVVDAATQAIAAVRDVLASNKPVAS